jgi:protein-tyrosine-phosphatase
VHPLAIKALAEIGIDISDRTSKQMNDFLKQRVKIGIVNIVQISVETMRKSTRNSPPTRIHGA